MAQSGLMHSGTKNHLCLNAIPRKQEQEMLLSAMDLVKSAHASQSNQADNGALPTSASNDNISLNKQKWVNAANMQSPDQNHSCRFTGTFTNRLNNLCNIFKETKFIQKVLPTRYTQQDAEIISFDPCNNLRVGDKGINHALIEFLLCYSSDAIQ